MASELIAAFSISFTVGIFIYFIVSPASFYRFRLSFKATQLTFFHYFFHITCIISSILLIGLLPEHPWSPMVPQGLMVLYTVIRRPYKLTSDNIRSFFNYLVVCLITSMKVFYFYSGDEIKSEWQNYYYPGVIVISLFFIVLWAYVVVIKDFVDKYYFDKKKKQNLVFNLFDEQ